eukprot:scaffold3210_cov402-Prasinococcus_capsulatus_cf.AAC.22
MGGWMSSASLMASGGRLVMGGRMSSASLMASGGGLVSCCSAAAADEGEGGGGGGRWWWWWLAALAGGARMHLALEGPSRRAPRATPRPVGDVGGPLSGIKVASRETTAPHIGAQLDLWAEGGVQGFCCGRKRSVGALEALSDAAQAVKCLLALPRTAQLALSLRPPVLYSRGVAAVRPARTCVARAGCVRCRAMVRTTRGIIRAGAEVSPQKGLLQGRTKLPAAAQDGLQVTMQRPSEGAPCGTTPTWMIPPSAGLHG